MKSQFDSYELEIRSRGRGNGIGCFWWYEPNNGLRECIGVIDADKYAGKKFMSYSWENIPKDLRLNFPTDDTVAYKYQRLLIKIIESIYV